MYLRAQTLEGKFQRIDQISVTPIQFPFGNSAYLYGSALMRFVAEHYGESALLKLVARLRLAERASRHPAGRAQPQHPARDRQDLGAALRRLQGGADAQYTAQRDAIVARGRDADAHAAAAAAESRRRGRCSRPTGASSSCCRRTATRGSAWRAWPSTRRRRRRTAPRSSGLTTELQTDAAGGPSLSADGRLLAYHEQQVVRTFYYYNDLFLYDRVAHKKRRLTEGARAWNPALSPDGKLVAFEVTAQRVARARAHAHRRARRRQHRGPLIPVANMEHVYTPIVVARRQDASRSRGGGATAGATSTRWIWRRATITRDHRRSRLRPRAALLARRQAGSTS